MNAFPYYTLLKKITIQTNFEIIPTENLIGFSC